MATEPKALVWIDLEMTGLNPDRDTILEGTLAGMDEWNRNQHGKSGLVARVQASQETLASAEAQTLAFIQSHCGPKSSPLCGNSVWQDRRFLARYMPELEAYLHYRLIDVSTVKELAGRWFPALPKFPKGEDHLALADIRASIGELRYYRERVFVAATSG
jgi:oligoribonuclease